MVHGLSLELLDRLDDRLPVWLVCDTVDGCHVEMMVTVGEAYDLVGRGVWFGSCGGVSSWRGSPAAVCDRRWGQMDDANVAGGT